MRNGRVLAWFVMLAACATGGGQNQSVDPVGTFDFTTSVEGTTVTGAITVARNGSAYEGSVTTDMTEVMPISSVTVEGQTMAIAASTPDGPVTMSLIFTGDTFTGTWSLGDMSGTLTGRRRAD
ncbi:MAG: hypothetical protein ACREL7_01735 [Longimicrobiales bacterium]